VTTQRDEEKEFGILLQLIMIETTKTLFYVLSHKKNVIILLVHQLSNEWPLKLHCDSRFQRAFTACSCISKVITLLRANQGNYFENATACSEHTLKATVAMQLQGPFI